MIVIKLLCLGQKTGKKTLKTSLMDLSDQGQDYHKKSVLERF